MHSVSPTDLVRIEAEDPFKGGDRVPFFSYIMVRRASLKHSKVGEVNFKIRLLTSDMTGE